MDPKLWGQVKEIYDRALDLSREERDRLFAEECSGDDELRREVESLLAAHEDAGDFLQMPAVKVARELVADNFKSTMPAISPAAPTLIGRELANYRIISLLGKGGMGEVYLAEDTILRRKIALKILPAKFTADEDRLKRFVQEAQSASSLNHPNIITIYEIGHVNDVHFIATEFIDGQTLRELIAESKLTLRDALDLATQIASAMAAAHAAGIVHRDIKPENIMVRPDGLAKVLDFGVAKLTESPPSMIDIHPSIANETTTKSGVLGTPQYMSPEQALGEKVDTRTDIFSLGIVLYEMITGSMPFVDESTGDVITALLRSEPLPLSHYLPEVPPELERIVEKTLLKDRKLRYQIVKDLQLDLKNLKEYLEFEARLAGNDQWPVRDRKMVKTKVVSTEVNMLPKPTAQSREVSNAQAVSSAVYLLKALNRHRRGVHLTLAAFALIVVGLVFGWGQLNRWRKRAEPFKTIKIDRLTTTGKALCSAISPDGRYFAYALKDAGQQSLWLGQVNTKESTQIVPSAPVNYLGITFSRDGNSIYYVRSEPVGVLYRTTLAGDVRKLLVKVDSPVTISPDGKEIAFLRFDYPAGNGVLMIAQENGTNERILSMRDNMSSYRRTGPSWSPDGKIIACAAENSVGAFHTVVGVTVEGGAETPLTSKRWEAVGQVVWLSDGGGLLVTAAERDSNLMQIWQISYPGGAPRRVTNDLSTYSNLSLTADSRTFTTIMTEQFMNIWVTPPGGDASSAAPITAGSQRVDGFRGLVWTHDNRIVYRTFANGNPNIWIMNSDGKGNRQLSKDADQNIDPTITPDSRYIVWSSSPKDNRNIWSMELDGGSPKQLTFGSGEWFPQFTPDGKWLVYQANGTKEIKRVLKKVPLAGGAPVQLTDVASFAPALSPDGKLIAFNYPPQAGEPNKIAVISIDGGPPIKVFEVTDETDWPVHWTPDGRALADRPVRWKPDGRALAYVATKGGIPNIWIQSLAGDSLKQLTHFTSHQIINFAWSRDGRQLALSRSLDNNDVVIISDIDR
jgi:eukaryotic-like serine/threonine-protein kinase